MASPLMHVRSRCEDDGGEHEVRIVLGAVAGEVLVGLPEPRPAAASMPASYEGPDTSRTP